MTFTSLAFLLFLPTVLLAYWLLRFRRPQNVLLVAASYFFYGWWDYRFCFLMLASSLVDYVLGLLLVAQKEDRRRKLCLVASLVCNLGLLGVFKYYDFFVKSFCALGDSVGLKMHTETLGIILPVGISFYTFQTLSYTIDIFRGRLRPTRNLVDYLAFVSFFPQLVAGPIERASRLLPQFKMARVFNWDAIGCGTRQILWGFFKKVVVADTLADLVTKTYDQVSSTSGPPTSGPHLAVATVLFAFQIYCDFSGYSDIAIGTARLFGIRLMRNFAYPYFSQNVREFWQRWHISLSTWFRDYVYIPLGGNRAGPLRHNLNLLVTFLVSGLWHGAAWRFVAWGLLHGVASMRLRQGHAGSPPQGPPRVGAPKTDSLAAPRVKPGGARWFPRPRILLRMLATFSLVCLFWVFFRAKSFHDAILIWWKMATEVTSAPAYHQLYYEYLAGGPLFCAINLVAALVVVEWTHRHLQYPLYLNHWPRPCRWIAYTLVFWFVAEYAEKTPNNPFIYFQF